MRAIIDATGVRPARHDPFLDTNPTPLLPVGGKEMLVHVLEALLRRGVKTFHVLLSDRAEVMEALLGDGSRWGCEIRPHLTRGPEEAWQVVELLAHEIGDDCLWLARGDSLPEALFDEEEDFAEGGAFLYDGEGGWTGWAFVEGARLGNLAGVRRLDEAEDRLHTEHGDRSILGRSLASWPLTRFIEANMELAEGRWPELLLTLREVEPSVWIGRNVQIHPNAQVKGPVFLDDDVSLGDGAVVGPGAVLGKGVIVEGGASVHEAVVLPRTYVGPGLALHRAVADRTLLAHADLNTTLVMDDPVLLGDLQDRSVRRGLAHLGERFLAFCLLVVSLPLLAGLTLLLHLWRRGPALLRRKAVRLPAPPMRACWRSFSYDSFGVEAIAPGKRNLIERAIACFGLDSLPAIRQIVAGRMHFVGIGPRSAEELQSLPDDWRAQVLQSRVGWLTLARALHGPSPSEDELFASEVWYAQCRSFREDLSVLRRRFFPRPARTCRRLESSSVASS